MIPMPSNTLEIALDFLKSHPDCYIFPIKRLEKAPPCFKNELELASADPAVIREWHRKYNGPNWGLALKKSHLIVIDVDTKPGKKGRETFTDLELINGPFPATLTVRTPSGGLHYYYREANNVVHQHRLGQYGFGEGIDSTNYVLLPGCWLSSGTFYQIVHDVPIADAPAWFGDYMSGNEESGVDQSVSEVDLDQHGNIKEAIYYLTHDAKPSVQGNNGEHTMLVTYGRLKDLGISLETSIALIEQYYNVPPDPADPTKPYCDPLWSCGDGAIADRHDVKGRNAWAYLTANAPGSHTAEAEFFPEPISHETDAWIRMDYQRAVAASQAYAAARLAEEIKDQPSLEQDTGESLALPPLAPVELGLIRNLKDLCAEWVWAVGQERFINRRDPTRQLKCSQFDSLHNHILKEGASIAKVLFKTDVLLKRFNSVAFRPCPPHPDMPTMPAEEVLPGRLYNVFRPSQIVPKEGNTDAWNEHINYLFQNEDDRNHVLNWMAWILQNPTKKPNHALLLVGKETGTGKSLVARIFEQIIGVHNTQRPKNSSMGGDFNSWLLNCRLCIIEEVYQPGRVEKLVAMRDLITEARVEVNIKGIPAFLVDNYVCVLGVSNHPDALPIDENDRRWLVIETFARPKGPDYYNRMFGILGESHDPALNDPDALSAIYYELLHRDLGTYTGYQRPAVTEAKLNMIELSRTDAEGWLHENKVNPPLSHTIVSVQDVMEAMPSNLQRQARLTTSIIPVFLKDKCGGVRVPHPIRLSDGTRHRVWILHGRSSLFGDDLDKVAAVYERERKSAMTKADEQAANDF